MSSSYGQPDPQEGSAYTPGSDAPHGAGGYYYTPGGQYAQYPYAGYPQPPGRLQDADPGLGHQQLDQTRVQFVDHSPPPATNCTSLLAR